LHGSNLEPVMSALGQKQTFDDVRRMSALPPKADIVDGDWHVRFVPIANIVACRHRRKTAPHNLCGMPQAFVS